MQRSPFRRATIAAAVAVIAAANSACTESGATTGTSSTTGTTGSTSSASTSQTTSAGSTAAPSTGTAMMAASSSSSDAAVYSSNATLSGMKSGGQVRVAMSDGNSMTLTQNGAFSMPASAGDGSMRATIASQPAGQTCTITSSAAGGTAVKCYTQSGPVTASSNQTISGLHITNPNGACITIHNTNDVVVSDNLIGPCAASAEGVGINVYRSTRIKVLDNAFNDVSTAVYAQESSNGALLMENNDATKVRGPMPRGQMIQLNAYSGSDIVIRCNRSDQALGGYGTGPEDHISMFASSGTASSPIRILHNKLRGGGSPTGGGIMTGDNGGSYIQVKGNILQDPGQYAIGIASGTNISVVENLVYAARNPWSNVGVYIWNQTPSLACASNEISGNRVNYTHRDGFANPYWNDGNCGGVITGTPNAFPDATLTAAIWNIEAAECRTSWRNSVW
jgi:hypothetical protein